jgi:hypothetical protein
MDKEILANLLYERDKEIESLKDELRSERRKKEDLMYEVTKLKPYEQRAKNSYDNWVTNAEREIYE